MKIPIEYRWYGGGKWDKAPQSVVQRGSFGRGFESRATIPEEIARIAHVEYARRHSQTFERLQERGGFSVAEVIMLLADTITRLEAGRGKARP